MQRSFLIAGLIALGVATPLGAQDAPTSVYGAFTFKRVKVQDAQKGDLITIQIDPVEQARILAALPKVDPYPKPSADAAPENDTQDLPPPKSAYAWYWDLVPAGIGEASGRFVTAIASLGLGPKGEIVAAPRMQVMQDLAKLYGTEILKATIGTNVSPALVLAMISVESGGRPDAVSSAGAQGLMQLIPATAERFGVKDSKDPVQNIQGGVAYLNWLMGNFEKDPLMVIAAYNAGEGAVAANKGVPPYAETRDYVPKVLAAWTVAQGLCATPPELVTDPCVFKVIASGG